MIWKVNGNLLEVYHIDDVKNEVGLIEAYESNVNSEITENSVSLQELSSKIVEKVANKVGHQKSS